MIGNIITAVFSGSRTCKTSPLYQYDYGQKMDFRGIPGLPVPYEVHFSNQEHGSSKTAIGDETGVIIPDECLTSGENIYAWVYLHTGANDGETEYRITIPVIKRARPSDAEPTPVQQDAITQAIALLQEESGNAEQSADRAEDAAVRAEEAAASINEEMIADAVSDYLDEHPITVTELDPTVPSWAKQPSKPIYTAQEVGALSASALPSAIDTALAQAKASGEFDGAPGAPGAKGDKGDPGEDGYTPIKGVDYFDGAKGDPGSPGADGFSPSASVSKSGTVTTITVTDKNGTTSAQVNDGQPGAQGQDGQQGADGFSPSATVSKSGSVTTITVTDKNGTTTAQVNDGQDGQPGSSGQDGQPGADGYSPSASVSKSGTVSTLTVTDKTGTTTVQINDGQDGQDGQDGEDGHTPVKGTDYWTAQDQAAIVQDVLGSQEISALQTKAITDTGGYYTTDTVEGALQEIGAEIAGVNTLIGTGVIS